MHGVLEVFMVYGCMLAIYVYIYMMDELVVLEVWLGWCELCMGCWRCLLIFIYKWIMDWLIGDYICIFKKNWLTG